MPPRIEVGRIYRRGGHERIDGFRDGSKLLSLVRESADLESWSVTGLGLRVEWLPLQAATRLAGTILRNVEEVAGRLTVDKYAIYFVLEAMMPEWYAAQDWRGVA